MRRIFGSVLFVLLLTVVGMTNAMAQSFTVDNLNYTVNDNGTTVTVTGHANGTSAVGALDIPESVTYGENTYSVTKIQSSAFLGCTHITSVTIPTTITYIGTSAFENCSGLLVLNYNAMNCSLPSYDYCNNYSDKEYHWLYGCNSLISLNIGDDVQTIPDCFLGNYSYYGYSSIVGTLVIPNSVTTIGEYAFYGCSGFASVVFGNSVTTIGKSAFYGCSNITSVVIPDSVVSFGSDVFIGCTSLTSAVIGNSVTYLGGTFSGCTNLSEVIIGNSVAAFGNSVFYNCTSLTSITIPNSIMSMGNNVFYGCTGLTSITIPNSVMSLGYNVFDGCSNLSSVVLGNSLVSVGEYLFQNCTSLSSINIPASVASIGNNIFSGCVALEQITVADGNSVFDSRDNCNAIIKTASNKLLVGCKNTIIPNSVITIGESAFSGCTSLVGSLDIPNSVISIEASAFGNCSGIVGELNIPESVTSLGDFAFGGCTGITSLTIPSSMTSIGRRVFANCSGLLHLNYNAINCSLYDTDYTYYYYSWGSTYSYGENHWLYGCNSLVSISIGESVQVIPDYFLGSYYTYSSISGTLTIPNSVTTIGKKAFYGCGGFVAATIGDGVISIDESAFYDCYNLKSITFGNALTSIGNSAFYNCNDLISVTFPNPLISIGESAFYGCNELSSIDIGSSMVSIGASAFYGCTSLASVIVRAATPPAFGSNAFYNVPKSEPVYVPCDSFDNYSSSNWGGFNNFNGMCSGDITVTANPAGGGSVIGSGFYEGGTVCTITAIPNEDFALQNWTKDGEVVSTEEVYSFMVTGDATYIANFIYSGEGGPEVVEIGTGTSTNENLPSHSYYGYTLSEQIYTADEIGGSGKINSVAFYNGGSTKTRNYDVYLVHTEKTTFASTSDWIAASENDLVFSGNVTMTAGDWTVIQFSAPFSYNGVQNLALIMDDNTNSYSSGMACRTFASNGYQALYVHNDGTDYDPFNYSDSGSRLSVKNQIQLSILYSQPIVFEDVMVKEYCVDYWDTDNDGELSYTEAAAVSDLGNVFEMNDEITSFNELKYFRGLTNIGANAFNGCIALESVELPKSLLSIGDGAFNECTALTVMKSHAVNPPVLGEDVFDEVSADALLYVPCGSGEAYTSVNWGGFNNILELCAGEITAVANPTVGGTIEGAGTYEGGETCTLTATANEGYTFANWTKNGLEVADTEEYSFLVTGGSTYVANFTINSYEITAAVEPEEGGTVEGAGTYEYGSTVTLTATANEGYTFINWTKGNEVVSETETCTFTVTGDETYIANFELNSYEIIVTANPETAGEATMEGSSSVYVSEVASIDFSQQGYTNAQDLNEIVIPIDDNVSVVFNKHDGSIAPKYYNSGASVRCYSRNTIEVSTTLGLITSITFTYGTYDGTNEIIWYEGEFDGTTWTGNAETVTFYIDGFSGNRRIHSMEVTYATEASGQQGSFTHGSTATLVATPYDGYLFMNWTKDGEVVSTDSTYEFTVLGPGEYVANFDQSTFEINATANIEEGGAVAGAGVYDHSATVTLTAVPNTGYTFINWTKDGEEVSTSATYNFVALEDASYVANFELNGYEIIATASPAAAGVVSGTNAYEHGDVVTLTAVPNTGYHFVNWTKNGEEMSTSMIYVFTAVADGEYVANFELNNYQITATVNPTNGGTVEGAGAYNHFETCTLTATAATGYHFVSWTRNGTVVSTSTTYSFTVVENIGLVANFELNIYYVTASVNPSYAGLISGIGTYNHFDNCELTVAVNEGYTFINWTKDGEVVSTDNTFSFTVTENASFVANFETNSYDITAVVNLTEGGTVDGGGNYAYGTTASLTAMANNGYSFVNWTENDMVVATSATYSFIVVSDRSLVANFVENINYHWDVNINQYADNMTVTGIILIEGVEQATEDLELGAFSGDECRGRERLIYSPMVDRYLLNLIIYGENGDEITFRLFDHEAGEEVDLPCANVITFEVNDDLGTPFYPYEFSFTDPIVEQTTNLVIGWNWYSTYIELNDIDGIAMLEETLGANCAQISSQTAFTKYYPGNGWYGSLTSIDNEKMYRLKMNNEAAITMTGYEADPAQHPITLSTGWTHIGFISSSNMSVGEAFSGLDATEGDLVKTQSAFAKYYGSENGWYGSLNTIKAGDGLMYKSTNTNNVTFTYPQASRGETKLNLTAENNHWMPDMREYPTNMTMMAVVELDGDELESNNYELAVFANGECRGSVQMLYVAPINRYMAFLTIAGEDNEELYFGLYDRSASTENLTSNERIVFNTDDIIGDFDNPFVVRFGNVEVDDVKIYPNPANVCDRINVVVPEKAVLEIVNALGEVVSVETVSEGDNAIKTPEKPGVYVLRIITENNSVTCRSVVLY